MINKNRLAVLLFWLLTWLQAFLKETKRYFSYKLCNYYFSEKDNMTVAEIKLQGKNITRVVKPQEILSDNDLVRSFSQEDIRLLTYLACKDEFAAAYKIYSYHLENEASPEVEFKDCRTNQVEKKSITEVLNDKHFIDKLSSQDAFRLGCFLHSATPLAKQ